jgi:hypothetical protein
MLRVKYQRQSRQSRRMRRFKRLCPVQSWPPFLQVYDASALRLYPLLVAKHRRPCEIVRGTDLSQQLYKAQGVSDTREECTRM